MQTDDKTTDSRIQRPAGEGAEDGQRGVQHAARQQVEALHQTTRSDAEIADMAARSRALRGADRPSAIVVNRRRPPPTASAAVVPPRPKSPAGGAHGKQS